MAKNPKPWWREDRQAWFVQIDGQRHNLGKAKKAAWRRYHELMAQPKKRTIVSADSLLAIIDAVDFGSPAKGAGAYYNDPNETNRWYANVASNILDIQAKNPGEFGQVVDISSRLDQLQDVSGLNGCTLLGCQRKPFTISVFVLQEFATASGIVERIAHLVQLIALQRLLAIKYRGTWDFPCFKFRD